MGSVSVISAILFYAIVKSYLRRLFVAVVTINRREKKIIAAPQITSRGFVYVKASRDLIRESGEIVAEIVEKHLHDEEFEWSKLKQDIRDRLSRFLFEQTKTPTSDLACDHGIQSKKSITQIKTSRKLGRQLQTS